MTRSHLSDFSRIAESAELPSSGVLGEETVDTGAHEDGVQTGLSREEQALRIVKKNMAWAMGLGLIPVPLVDLVAASALQAKTLKDLSDLYGIPFKEHAVKNVVAVLINGLGSIYLGKRLAHGMMRLVPGIGPLMGIVSTPIATGALTYATGKVFIQHFECGGTLLDFDPAEIREYFRDQFEQGKLMAVDMRKSTSTAS